MNKKLIIVVLMIASIGGVVFLTQGEKTTDEKSSITKTTTPLTYGAISQTVFSDGYIATNISHNLYSQISSTVTETFVSEGDFVKAGDVIAILDTSTLIQALKSAEYQLKLDSDALKDIQAMGNATTAATYQKSLNSYRSAQTEHANNEALYRAGVISSDALNNSKASLENAYVSYLTAKDNLNTTDIGSDIEQKTLKVEIDQMNIDSILAEIESATVTAPIDGTIVSAITDINRSINIGDLLYTIEDLTNLVVEATISEYEINDIKVGQDVLIEMLGYDTVYHGKIISIAPKGSTDTEVTIPITVEISDEDLALKPNFTANIEIIIASKEKALIVPYEAIQESKRGSMLLVSRKGKEIMVPVEKGIISDIYIEVISDQLLDTDEIVLITYATKDTPAGLTVPGMGLRTGNKKPTGK